MLTRAAWLAALATAACARAAAPGDPCADVVARNDRELSRAAGCQRIAGDLRVDGAVSSLAPLASLEVVEGDVVLGPAIDLGSLRGLERLREIGGDFEVTGNPFASGVFLGGLGRVGGDLRIGRNLSATVISLHALREVGGDLWLARQPSAVRIDLSSLERVGGDAAVLGHGVLDVLVLPGTVEVGGAVELCVPDAFDRSALPERWRAATCDDEANPRPPGLDSGPAVR